jgi:nucleotide-binding universal stress UspA family protein
MEVPMMNALGNPVGEQILPNEGLGTDKAEAQRLRILAVVDLLDRTDRVIDYLLLLRSMQAPIEVIVLNIQPEPLTGRLRGYGSFKQQVIRERLINDLGRPVVMRAGHKLDSAGIVHRDRIEVGDPAQTILQVAREEKCDQIVLAETRPGPIRRWLMRVAGVAIGSVASVVVGLSRVPLVVAR